MSFRKILTFGHRRKTKLLRKLITRIISIRYSCDIPVETNIDESVWFAHDALGCVVHKDSIIEKNVFIQHRVTIGVKRSGEGAPIICEDVAIGPGAIIIGNITVGRGAVVGAGAVVVKDVPPYAVVGGVPATILHYIPHHE